MNEYKFSITGFVNNGDDISDGLMGYEAASREQMMAMFDKAVSNYAWKYDVITLRTWSDSIETYSVAWARNEQALVDFRKPFHVYDEMTQMVAHEGNRNDCIAHVKHHFYKPMFVHEDGGLAVYVGDIHMATIKDASQYVVTKA